MKEFLVVGEDGRLLCKTHWAPRACPVAWGSAMPHRSGPACRRCGMREMSCPDIVDLYRVRAGVRHVGARGLSQNQGRQVPPHHLFIQDDDELHSPLPRQRRRA